MEGFFFRDIYSGVNGKWYNENAFSKSWEEFDELKNINKNIIAQIITNINKNIIAQIIIMLMLINMEHHYDFLKIMDGLILWILMFGFVGMLDID